MFSRNDKTEIPLNKTNNASEVWQRWTSENSYTVTDLPEPCDGTTSKLLVME